MRTPAATDDSPAPGRRANLPLAQTAGLLLVILILGLILTFVGGWITDLHGHRVNNFFRLSNLLGNILTPMSMNAIMAVGATMVIISGGIDISVGAIFGLAALGTAGVLQFMPQGASAFQVIPVAMLVSCAIGVACGLINGLLIVSLRLHPFIVTLGTMGIFRSLCGVTVPPKMLPLPGRDLPDSFTHNFMQFSLAPFIQPWPVILMVVVVVAGAIYLGLTVAGRKIYAIGGNEEAARFSGLAVGRLKVGVYAVAGLTAGIAGMIYAGLYGSAASNVGNGQELAVIAAAVMGGASLSGGRGSALGAILGAIIIRIIEDGISILHFDQEYSMMIIGIAIIAAAAIDRLSQYVQARRLTRFQSKSLA